MTTSTTARFHYAPDDGPEFVWHGGAYIDVGYTQPQGEPGIHGGDFHAYDCINVWDYAEDKPRIDRTLDAFEQRCRDWLAAQDESE